MRLARLFNHKPSTNPDDDIIPVPVTVITDIIGARMDMSRGLVPDTSLDDAIDALGVVLDKFDSQ